MDIMSDDEIYDELCKISGLPAVDRITASQPEINEGTSGISYDSIINYLRSLDVKFADELNKKG